MKAIPQSRRLFRQAAACAWRSDWVNAGVPITASRRITAQTTSNSSSVNPRERAKSFDGRGRNLLAFPIYTFMYIGRRLPAGGPFVKKGCPVWQSDW